MKTRDSGMPDEAWWERLLDGPATVRALGLDALQGDVVEFGCGYGTFTLPVARGAAGLVHALDIDPAMVARVAARAAGAGLGNIRPTLRDFAAEGTGLPDAAAACALLFNILHAEDPRALLREARRTLRPGGLLAVTHWIPDPSTPRGPALDIRPRPEQCRAWAHETGFTGGLETIPLPPYHFGLLFRRP